MMHGSERERVVEPVLACIRWRIRAYKRVKGGLAWDSNRREYQ